MPFPISTPVQTTRIDNHYWQVGSDATKVYSSKKAAYVPVTDVGYVAWSAMNTVSIIDAQTLFDTLVELWVPLYLANGIQIVSTGNPALNGTYPLDPLSQQQINGSATSIAAGRGVPGGGSTFIYQGHSFTEATFLNFADGASNYVYNVYHSLGQIVMTGSGSLPTQPVTIA